MADLKNIIYLSNADYDTLVANGSVTISGTTITYDANTVYITPEENATTSKAGLMSASDKSKLDSLSPLPTTTTADKILLSTSSGPAWSSSSKGYAYKPLYLDANGILTAGADYAGGTLVTINNVNKYGTTATFYAPLGSGATGQILVANGNNAPTWSSWSSAGFLKTNTSGVVSIDTNTYLTTTGTAADSSKLNGQSASYYQKALPTTTTAGKVLKSTSTAGTVQWADDTNTNYYPIRSYTSGLKISSYSGSQNCELYVPNAAFNQSGVVSTGSQTFGGAKRFAYYNDDDSPVTILFNNNENYFLTIVDQDSQQEARIGFSPTSSWEQPTMSLNMPKRDGTIGLEITIDDLTIL